MTRGEFGVWNLVLPAKDGQPAIPHQSKVKVEPLFYELNGILSLQSRYPWLYQLQENDKNVSQPGSLVSLRILTYPQCMMEFSGTHREARLTYSSIRARQSRKALVSMKLMLGSHHRSFVSQLIKSSQRTYFQGSIISAIISYS